MPLSEDLSLQVFETLRDVWDIQTTKTVPRPEALRLNSNHAKYLENAVVLYADIDGSTDMVDTQVWFFSAEIYKCYLRCAAQIIWAHNGEITAYDGDRVMAIFTGNTPNTDAVKTALKINWAVHHIIRPAVKARYSENDYVLKHVVGIDRSPLHAARIGVRGDNDLVWIGKAANYAAKLCAINDGPTWITKDVFDMISHEVKVSGGQNMWSEYSWKTMNQAKIYRSTWTWKIDAP